MDAITSTERPATAIRNRVCSRQSASAADTVVVAMTDIGKSFSLRAEASRSRPSIGLVNADRAVVGVRQDLLTEPDYRS